MVISIKARKNLRSKYAIELFNVSTIYYGELTPAIKDINLKVKHNEFILITGPNGAGKTTLLETILGLLKPYKGKIFLLGYEIPKEAHKARKYCAYLPQNFMKPSDEPFLVKDVVAMGLASLVESSEIPSEYWDRVYEVLDLFGIKHLANKPIGKLSGGQQQKVYLARVLIRNPKVIFLDEPFSSLDRKSRLELANLLSKMNEDMKVTILMVSHDVTIIPKACNRIIEMNNGMIVNEREL